jgi:quercetin dioxygenase-like cupin family protein
MTMPGPQVKSWPNESPLSAAAVEERMKAEGLPFYRWSNGPGDVYPAHSHTFHKVIYVVRGGITFGLPQSGASLTLRTGDRLDLPAGIVHDAVVGGQGVVCLEGHR